MKIKPLFLMVGGIAALGAIPAASSAGAMPAASLERAPAGSLTEVRHRGRPHRAYRVYPRPRLYVSPGGYDPGFSYYYPDYSYYYPPVRGFDDPNNVPRGNMRGCTVDLGYGRYESCDK